MAMYDVVKLITQTVTVDSLRMEVYTETKNTVFAEVESISQAEFFAARNADLKPDFRFKIFFGDYHGEKLLEYQGDRYGIYRTFRNGDRMELYAERKAGRDE